MSTKLKLLTSAKVNGTIPVYKYESERTGLKIVLAQVEGPLVNGYFTLGNPKIFPCLNNAQSNPPL